MPTGDLATQKDRIFKYIDHPTRFLPYNNTFHNAVTYELSNANVTLTRSVYGILDWLRDIGGLWGALYAICVGLVAIIHFQGTNMFLMTEMFSVPQTDRESNPKEVEDKRRQETMRGIQSRNNVQWNCCRIIITNIYMILPKSCHCLCFRPERRDRIFIRGFKSLEKEIHVVYVLK